MEWRQSTERPSDWIFGELFDADELDSCFFSGKYSFQSNFFSGVRGSSRTDEGVFLTWLMERCSDRVFI